MMMRNSYATRGGGGAALLFLIPSDRALISLNTDTDEKGWSAIDIACGVQLEGVASDGTDGRQQLWENRRNNTK